MTMRLEELVGLELFVDTVRLGSISAAAREHHVSQPSATERLHGLERRLGVALLRRGPGGSAPTPEGEAVAGWAREVLESVARLATGVGALRETAHAHPLRVMASLTVAEYVLPGWLHAHARAGGAPVELAVGNSVAVARAVAEGDARVGFVETPRRFVGVRSLVVGGDELVVVVASTHRWARRRRPVEPEELAATPLLQRELGSGTRDAFERALHRALGAAGTPIVEPAAVMASTQGLKAAAVAGVAPTVLSELAVAPELAAGTLVAVPVAGLDLSREFRALWLPGHHDPQVQRFLRLRGR